MTYDFHQLSPHDLEILVRDLLQAEWNVRLETFKTGRDQGVDFRYARGAGNLIGQVKHYLRTGIKGLLRDLKKEVPKLNKLNPSSYVLATSVSLSKADKSNIAALFGGKLAVSDIFGQEDLNNLLADHSEIEKKHYKLWLASRGVLDKLLNNEIVTQTEFHVEKVHATICRHVRSDTYQQALDILDTDRVVIISGAPGVGKTTLANMLLYAHLERGWAPVIVRRDILEGAKLFQRGTAQIFHFDDFMGATFLGDGLSATGRNDDRAITDFIEMVRASPTARLILTTREHIFRQGVTLSERLRHAGLDSHKVTLHVGDYSVTQRAQILYNHVYFSNLPTGYKDQLLDSDFYLEIVRHPKFNPRLIEWLSTFNRVRKYPVNEYQSFVLSLLNDPSEVWMHAYEQQISDAARSLLLTLYSLDGRTDGATLKVAFKKLHERRAVHWGFPRRPEDWSNAMSELLNAFIQPSGRQSFKMLDPSVNDLVNSVIRKSPEVAIDMIVGAVDYIQIQRIWQLADREIADLKTAITTAGADVVRAIRRVVLAETKIVRFTTGMGRSSWSAEERLARIIPLANGIRTPEMLHLVKDLISSLQAEWLERAPIINDGAEVLQALRGSSWQMLENPSFEAEVERRLLQEAELGCRSDELREIIRVVDLEGPENAAILARLQRAFRGFGETIETEVRNCNDSDDLQSLEEDLELFARTLGVEVGNMLDRVREAYSRYEERGERRGSQVNNIDSYTLSPASEEGIRDMFASLRSDRPDPVT